MSGDAGGFAVGQRAYRVVPRFGTGDALFYNGGCRLCCGVVTAHPRLGGLWVLSDDVQDCPGLGPAVVVADDWHATPADAAAAAKRRIAQLGEVAAAAVDAAVRGY